MRAAHEGGVQHVGNHDIVDEARLAAQQRFVFDPQSARSDQRRHRQGPLSLVCEAGRVTRYFEIASAAFSSTSLGVA